MCYSTFLCTVGLPVRKVLRLCDMGSRAVDRWPWTGLPSYSDVLPTTELSRKLSGMPRYCLLQTMLMFACQLMEDGCSRNANRDLVECKDAECLVSLHPCHLGRRASTHW